MPERQTSAKRIPRRAKLARAVHVESYTLARRKALMEHLEARQSLMNVADREKADRSQRSKAG